MIKCSTKPEKVNSKEIKVVYSPKKYSTYDHHGKFQDAHQTKAKMKCALVQKVCFLPFEYWSKGELE